MELELANGRTIRRPGLQQIETALAAARNGEEFVILSRDSQNYIQAAGSSSGGFYLEYRGGAPDKHYRSVRNDIPHETTVEIFKEYAARNQRWWHLAEWKQHRLAAAHLHRWYEPLALIGWLLPTVTAVFSLALPDVTETWAGSIGLQSIHLVVYSAAIGLTLSYPWAREYVRSDPAVKGRTWAAAKMTLYGAPLMIAMSLLYTLIL